MNRIKASVFWWIICRLPTAPWRKYQVYRFAFLTFNCCVSFLTQYQMMGVDTLVIRQILMHRTAATRRSDADNLDNGSVPAHKGKNTEKSVEDLSRSASNSPSHGASKASKAFTVR